MSVMIEARTRGQLIKDANAHIRTYLNRKLDTDAIDIARTYQASRDRLLTNLRGIYDTYLAEDPTYVRAKSTGAFRQMQARIDRELQMLTDEVGQRATAKMAELLNTQPDVLEKRLGRFMRQKFFQLPVTAQNVLGELTTSVIGGATFEDRILSMSDDMKRVVTNDLRRGLINGDDFSTIRARISKTFGVDKLKKPAYSAYGSVKVYKNEARRQWNLLMKQQADRMESYMVWFAMIDDPDVTPGCVARHGLRIDEDLDGDSPPRHYNAWHPSTVVQGSFIAGYRLMYNGPMLQLQTRGGQQLTVTPNHPILTRHGMRAANQLCKGDQLLRYHPRDEVDLARIIPSGASTPDQKKYGPTSIEHVFETLAIAYGVTRSGWIAKDFHGDAQFGQGEIDVVVTNHILWDCMAKLQTSDDLARFALEQSKLRQVAHARSGDMNLVPTSVTKSFASFAGPDTLEIGLDVTTMLPPQDCCFGSSPELEAMLLKNLASYPTRDAGFASGLIRGMPSAIKVDEIVDLTTFHYHGYVYDLQTENNCIVAQNTIASQCRCTIAVMDDRDEITEMRLEGSAQLKVMGYSRAEARMEEGDFDPAKHPRDERGRFGSGSGGSDDADEQGFMSGGGPATFGRMRQEDIPGGPETTGPPGEYLFHTTSNDNLQDIATDGLQPQDPSYRGEQDTWPDGGSEARVYFVTRAPAALKFSEPDHVLLRVKHPEKLRTEFKDADYYTRQFVRPEDVEVLGKDKQWHQLTGSKREAWDPSQHPRDEDGKFAGGGGSSPEDIEQWADDAGAKFDGIQSFPSIKADPLVLITDNVSQSTGIIPLSKISKKAVQDKVDEIRAKFKTAGWGWGHETLQPVSTIHEVLHDEGTQYKSVPWRHLPREAAGYERGIWTDLQVAVATDHPDSVLLRKRGGEDVEVKGWSSWRPVKPSAYPIQTLQGLADDSATIQPSWDPRSERLPREIIARWPALRNITFPVVPVFAIALVDQQTAENLTTGALPPSEVLWQSGLPALFPQALMQLFWRQGHPPNAHFVFGEVIEKEVRPRTIVNVTTGEVIYATNDFASDILSPYTRVAAAVRETDGRIWAIMPRGLARWVLPGGHIDAGESPRAAVVREMLEETGQHIRVQRLIGTLYRPWSRTMVFLCANITKHKDWSSSDETDAVLAIDFRDLATDERLFLQRHGISARWTEAAFDPAEHPRDEKGQFGSGGAGEKSGGGDVKMKKSKNPENEFGYTVLSGGKSYEVYFDRQSSQWLSLDLVNVSGQGGSPVDFIAHSKSDLLDRIRDGSLAAKLARWKKS